MSDRSWRDFFESRSFYEYEIFSQKLPLRYTVNRTLPPLAPSLGSESDSEEGRRRRRCAGFYWCCCLKILALLAVALILSTLIGGLSYYFSKKESANLVNNSTSSPSLNPITNGTTVTQTSTHDPFTSSFSTATIEVQTTLNNMEVSSSTVPDTSGTDSTVQASKNTETTITDDTATTFDTISPNTSPFQTQTINETFALASSQEPVDVTSSIVYTTGSNFSITETTENEWTTSPSLGNKTDFSSSPGLTIGLSTENQDVSTISAEETTIESGREETTTHQNWMTISSTSLSDDFTDDEDISTPEPWTNVSSSTLSDGLPDETGSGMSEDD